MKTNQTMTDSKNSTASFSGKLMYTIELETEIPIHIPDGPNGARYIFELKKGTGKVTGPDLNGLIIGPTSDFVTIRSDGSITLDIHMVIQTDDDATIYTHTIGRSKRVGDIPKQFEMRSATTHETGVKKYKYLNNKVFYGFGTKDGLKIRWDFYDFL